MLPRRRFLLRMVLAPGCAALADPSALLAQTTAGPDNALQRVHDPCIARDGDTFYVFCTGRGTPIRRSKDLIHWENAGRVFEDDVPDWARAAIPGSTGLWAPDICRFNNRFHLYYSVSTFGKNRSLIGTASTPTLDPSHKDYKWTDDGKVFESFSESNFNAIDPNVVVENNKPVALAFGSFWSGIKMVRLDAKTGKPAAPDAPPISLAQRPAPDAIEAPFLIRHGKRYYLFVSFDFCCRGVRSTYNIRVGRADRLEGPYRDKDGTALMENGGTLVLGTEGDVIGPGHCAVLQDRRGDFLVHHFYDAARNGVPTLQIRPLTWTVDGWPVAGKPLTE